LLEIGVFKYGRKIERKSPFLDGEYLTQKLHSTAKLVEDLRIAVDDGRAHSVCLDLPPELGTDKGPTALELGVMSYSGCIATIFALMAKKMRVPLKDLQVKMEAVKSDEAGTITEAGFDILAKADAPEDRIQRIFELTMEHCPVGKLFEKAGVKTTYNIIASKE
jgi:putative redox protein